MIIIFKYIAIWKFAETEAGVIANIYPRGGVDHEY
jgi:uncharacterized membrane protein YkgB